MEGDGVVTDRHAIDELVGVVWVHEDAHVRGRVINPMEIALQEGALIPQAGPDALDGLIDAFVGGLVWILSLGAIQAGTVEVR